MAMKADKDTSMKTLRKQLTSQYSKLSPPELNVRLRRSPPIEPSAEQAEWSVMLVRHGIAAFTKRISQGDVGEANDDAREKKLLSFLCDYIAKSVPPSYKVPPKMIEDGLEPRSYLQTRSAFLPAFCYHKLGATKALDDTLRSLVASGWLMEVKHDKVVEGYDHHGKTYRVLDLPTDIIAKKRS